MAEPAKRVKSEQAPAQQIVAGFGMVVRGLADAARWASYKLAFGALGSGIVVHFVGFASPSGALITTGTFLLSAKLGSHLDSHVATWLKLRADRRMAALRAATPPELPPGPPKT